MPARTVFATAVLILAWTAASLSAPGPARRPGKGMVLAFVPIGASGARVAALDEIFRTELRLETAILPAMEPAVPALDQRRHQLVGEKLIEQIRAAHRQLVSTGKVAVVGVTEKDMFIRANPRWGFVFSARSSASPIAVVSSFRMDPRNLGDGADDAVLQSRLRKMVSKNVGQLLYGLPASRDRHNLLFSDILAVEDLDAMEEAFASSGMLPAQ